MILAFEARHAWDMADLRARHHHRTRGLLSLADCALIATAQTGDSIASADRPLLAAAAAEGLETVSLAG